MTDEEWFEEQWRCHSAAVWAFARRRVGEADSEDVVVDSYLVLWQKLPIRHDLPWLLGVARNVIGSRYRSQLRQSKLLSRVSSQRTEDDTDGHREDLSDEVLSIQAALERLSSHEREAVQLVAWDGLTPADAAAVVGCSGSTFRMRLLRGRRHLRALLKDHEASNIHRKETGS